MKDINQRNVPENDPDNFARICPKELAELREGIKEAVWLVDQAGWRENFKDSTYYKRAGNFLDKFSTPTQEIPVESLPIV